MRFHLLAVAASVAIATGASAQSTAEGGFGGIKVGATIDYRWLHADYDLPAIGDDIDENRGGVGFRGHLGMDRQIGGAVVGVEGGIGRGGARVRERGPGGDYSLRPGWNWDISGRAGFLMSPSALVYGRAGYSWLRVREDIHGATPATPDRRFRGTEGGFLFGGGIEAAISPGMFGRVEYNRADYGDGLSTSRALAGFAIGF